MSHSYDHAGTMAAAAWSEYLADRREAAAELDGTPQSYTKVRRALAMAHRRLASRMHALG